MPVFVFFLFICSTRMPRRRSCCNIFFEFQTICFIVIESIGNSGFYCNLSWIGPFCHSFISKELEETEFVFLHLSRFYDGCFFEVVKLVLFLQSKRYSWNLSYREQPPGSLMSRAILSTPAALQYFSCSIAFVISWAVGGLFYWLLRKAISYTFLFAMKLMQNCMDYWLRIQSLALSKTYSFNDIQSLGFSKQD